MAGLHGYRDFSSGETALDRVANHVLLPRQLRDLVAEAQTERQHLLEQLQTLKEELAAERKSKKLAEAAQPTAWNEERARWQSQLAALKQHNQLVEGMYWNVRAKMEAMGGHRQQERHRLQRGKVIQHHGKRERPPWGGAARAPGCAREAAPPSFSPARSPASQALRAGL